MPRLPRRLALAVPLLVAVAACAGSGTALPSPLSTSAPSVAAATPVATPDACAKDALITLTAGKLTIGTANPAFPPYYRAASPQPSDSPWKIGDPRTGEGLEAATAYAVAQKLGFTKDDVVWVATPLKTATEPGAKPFDYYLAQVPYSPDLSQAVDLSDGYFDVNQAVLALKDNAIANASSVAALKAFKLGGPVGTSYTSITDQIKPTQEAASYDTLDAGLSALQAKKIDGLVVDLPTAFHLRDVQLTNAVIVGSLPTVGVAEAFTIVISKPGATVAGVSGNPLTACVNRALAALKADGTLKQITDKWITSQGAPELT
jgi:polar amino acid transport system substrate-binding protein